MTDTPTHAEDEKPAKEKSPVLFGTFQGVFRPTILTILGAMLYLREGWVIGQAGLGGFILLLLCIYTITTTTALSIASITTNIRIGQGGVFSIIAQSMGLEAGGAIGVPFYLAQSLGAVLYIFAFVEGWQMIFPGHPTLLVAVVVYLVVLGLAYLGPALAFWAQGLVLAALTAVLASLFFALDGVGPAHVIEFYGPRENTSMIALFALFFPAATGILVGTSMSGTLKNPRRSIPRGTIAAVLMSFSIYLLIGIWLALVATPEELRSNYAIMADKAPWRPMVLMGLLLSTASAALSSMVAAPQMLTALGEAGILPWRSILAEKEGQKGRRALLLTAVIVSLGMLSGSLDAIAPLLTVFFLITYATINVVLLVEQSLGLPSFRPTFRVPLLVPLIGSVTSLLAVVSISPIFGLMSLVLVVVVYGWLVSRRLETPYETARSGLVVNLAGWAAKRAAALPDHSERSWKPDLLVPVQTTTELAGIYRLLRPLVAPKGSIKIVGLPPKEGGFDQTDLNAMTDDLQIDGIYTATSSLVAPDFGVGVTTSLSVLKGAFFPPNIIFVAMPDKSQEALQRIRDSTVTYEVGLAIFAPHAKALLGRERWINLWVRDQSPDWQLSLKMASLDLSLLMALQITNNWPQARLRLLCVVDTEAKMESAQSFLLELSEEARIPGETALEVVNESFDTYLDQAPRADINIFGLPEKLDVAWMQSLTDRTRSSCLFVRASGKESALA